MAENIIDTVLLDQFRVEAFIASGGMGAVYRVWDLKRNVPLAMKILHAELADDPSVLKRFKREANALKRLAHPNIVPFYGLFETLDFAFLLEHYVDGPTLKEILRKSRGKPLPVTEALIYLKALCSALGYAHSNGVVHCDVKPANVMVDRGGRIYLTDFGIARHAESTTTTFGTVGTPAYMAPEQILGRPVTPATDIYALGVILFELLTSQRPFRGTEEGTENQGSTANERIRYGHLHLSPPNPRSLNETLSPDLCKVILKALNKDATDRYPSASSLFNAVCDSVGIQTMDVGTQVILPDATSNGSKHLDGKVVVSPRTFQESSRLALFGAGGMVVFVGLVGTGMIIFVIWLLGQKDRPMNPPSSPIPDQVEYTTQAPPATYTPLPTYTPYPTFEPSETSIPASETPYIPPTHPPSPVPQVAMIYLTQNCFCRRGPGTDYTDVTTFSAGDSFPIIGKDSDGWWLVKIDLPSVTRRKACWIYGDGHNLKGDYPSVPYMEDFEVSPDYNPT